MFNGEAPVKREGDLCLNRKATEAFVLRPPGYPGRLAGPIQRRGDRRGRARREAESFPREVGTEKTLSFFRRPDEVATLVLAGIMRGGISSRAYNIQPLPPGFVPRPNLAKAIVESLVGRRCPRLAGMLNYYERAA
jgi:hypothetical protein